MNIRPIQEEDIEQVIHLFRKNYGDDYFYPEFYDPQWVKRGIYSDTILWLVIEDEGRVVGSGAVILDSGDYDDQIAEIGRLVVDPSVGGKGLGQTIMKALVDASNNQVEFLFAEARTVHSKTQKINDQLGLVPLGFLPMVDKGHPRQSDVFYGRLCDSGRKLRQEGAARLIPVVAPIASLALSHMEMDEPVKIVPNIRPYPLYERLVIKPLTTADLVRVVKIEQGRTVDPEVHSGLHLDQGISKLIAKRASYLVASEEGRTLGAVGYLYSESESSVRIVELIAREDAVKGGLLRRVVEEAEQVHKAEVIDIDVSATHPRIQRTMVELGFLPVAYVPGMVFHNTNRWDVVRMMKLNIAWNLGQVELIPSAQAVYDIVTLPFIRRDAQRRIREAVSSMPAFQGLSPLEMDFLVRICEDIKLAAGETLVVNGLCVILEGGLQVSNRSLGPGECFGERLLLADQGELTVIAGQQTSLLRLSPHPFNELIEHYPHLGLKLFRNFCQLTGYFK
jgi:N-acetylglutamate synthase-like GNAT family acetyltransferase